MSNYGYDYDDGQADFHAAMAKMEAANNPPRDLLSDPPETKQEEAPTPKPALDHNVMINPYAGQGSVTSSNQEQTGKPMFFNNAGQVFDAAKVDEHTTVRIGAIETNTGNALRQGYIKKGGNGEYVLTSLGRAYQGQAQQQAAPQTSESIVPPQHQAVINKLVSRVDFGSGASVPGMIGAAVDAMIDGKNVEFGNLCRDLAETVRANPETIAPWLDDCVNDCLESGLNVASKATGIHGDELWNRLNSKAGNQTRKQFTKACVQGDRRTIVQIANALRFGDTLR